MIKIIHEQYNFKNQFRIKNGTHVFSTFGNQMGRMFQVEDSKI